VLVVSLTRLRLRSVWFFPAIVWNTWKINKQVVKADGFVIGKLFLDSRLTFWTMTAWRDATSMKAFRNAPPHQIAMRKLPSWCDEAAYARWEQETDQLTDWKEAHRQLSAAATLSPVKNPSKDHLARRFAQPKWPPRTEQHLHRST
jgi:hypothetical protein